MNKIKLFSVSFSLITLSISFSDTALALGMSSNMNANKSDNAGPSELSAIILRGDLGIANYNGLSDAATRQAVTYGASITADVNSVLGFTLMGSAGTAASSLEELDTTNQQTKLATIAFAPTLSIHSTYARFYIGPTVGWSTLTSTSDVTRAAVSHRLSYGAVTGLDVPMPFARALLIQFSMRAQALAPRANLVSVQSTQFLGGLGLQL